MPKRPAACLVKRHASKVSKRPAANLLKRPAAKKLDLPIHRSERHEGDPLTWKQIVDKTREVCGIQIAVSNNSRHGSDTIHLKGYSRECSDCSWKVTATLPHPLVLCILKSVLFRTCTLSAPPHPTPPHPLVLCILNSVLLLTCTSSAPPHPTLWSYVSSSLSCC